MSIQPQEEFSVPEQTRRIAQAAFPKGCACLSVGDVLGRVYQAVSVVNVALVYPALLGYKTDLAIRCRRHLA